MFAKHLALVAFRGGLLVWGLAAAVASSGAVAKDPYPPELQRLYEFAEQAFFKGDFADASHHVKAAREWIKEIKNRKALAAVGIPWASLQANTYAFDAWIEAEKGNEGRAEELFSQAHKALGKLVLPLFRALVDIQYGDFELSRAFLAIDDDEVPPHVREVLVKRDQRLKSASKHYRDAADVLAYLKEEESNFAKRIKGRAEHAMARCEMAFGNLTAAERHLQDAERLYRAMPHFDVFVAPGVQWPKSLKQVEQELGEMKDLKPGEKVWYTTEYARTIVEWLRLHADQAEFVVKRAVERGDDPAPSRSQAEKFFRKASDLCDVNFRPDHPFRFRLDVSRGVFYVNRAKEARASGKDVPEGPEKDRALAAEKSFFLDAAFAAQEALAGMEKLRDELKQAENEDQKGKRAGDMLGSHPLRLEALLLELSAHDAGFPLAGRDRASIIADMEDWLLCRQNLANKNRPEQDPS